MEDVNLNQNQIWNYFQFCLLTYIHKLLIRFKWGSREMGEGGGKR